MIKKDMPLGALNSFGVEARSAYYAEVNTIDKIKFAVNFAAYNQVPVLVLGGGSNTLFTHDHVGLVLRPTIRGIAVAEDMPRHVVLRVGAGVPWDGLVEHCVQRGLYGLENLSGIPGDVGAAPVQNIGAYGVEVKDCIAKVEAFDMQRRELLELSAEECHFGYRDSIFKRELRGKTVITHVSFKLQRTADLCLDYGDLRTAVEALGDPTLGNVRQAVLGIRAQKLPDPKVLGNAGSFFKNPVVPPERCGELKRQHGDMPMHELPDGGAKLSAAWLIDQCGWKGRRVGACGVHDQQPLVLVNHGGATGAELLALGRDVQQSVREHFGIELELEVNVA